MMTFGSWTWAVSLCDIQVRLLESSPGVFCERALPSLQAVLGPVSLQAFAQMIVNFWYCGSKSLNHFLSLLLHSKYFCLSLYNMEELSPPEHVGGRSVALLFLCQVFGK